MIDPYDRELIKTYPKTHSGFTDAIWHLYNNYSRQIAMGTDRYELPSEKLLNTWRFYNNAWSWCIDHLIK